MGTPGVVVDVCLTAGDLAATLACDVGRGLTASPKELPPKWFYDERGSALFEEITHLAEYYPTRCESEILDREAAAVASAAAAARVETLVELGSGTSAKTRLLLDALAGEGALRRFVPFDVSEGTLRSSSGAIAREYAGLEVHAVVGDFELHLDRLPLDGRTLVAFLGGTIGNLGPHARAELLQMLAKIMARGDLLLLGTDLVKDPRRLVAAYDDVAGVTAAFNRNVLHVVNRSLGAEFVPERFAHRARWDPEQEWMEMALVAGEAMEVRVNQLDLVARFAAGEALRTEISAKFRRSGISGELAVAGLELVSWMTDARGDFALSLSRRS